MGISKVIMMLVSMFIQDAAGNDRSLIHGIHAGLIQSDRIKGSKDSDIRNNRQVILSA